MSSIRFIMLGGFLGAGKTTTIARLARHYQSQGQKVGIVTNDQATDLVDTNSLRAQGFDVGEVAGAVLLLQLQRADRDGRRAASNRPGPTSSSPSRSAVAPTSSPPSSGRCSSSYGGTFDVAPYAVLLKPSHGSRILRGEAKGGFSPQAAYIFKKQLEEADVIVINRIDELSADEADELTGTVGNAVSRDARAAHVGQDGRRL